MNNAIPPTLPFSKGGAKRGFKYYFANVHKNVLPFEKACPELVEGGS